MKRCKVPPLGWYCTREEGHDGPCAALPMQVVRLSIVQLISGVMMVMAALQLSGLFAVFMAFFGLVNLYFSITKVR